MKMFPESGSITPNKARVRDDLPARVLPTTPNLSCYLISMEIDISEYTNCHFC